MKATKLFVAFAMMAFICAADAQPERNLNILAFRGWRTSGYMPNFKLLP